jgi:acetyl esterase
MTGDAGQRGESRVPLDPDVVRFRDRQLAQGFPSYVAVGPERAREVSRSVTRWRGSVAARTEPDPVESVEDVQVPGTRALRARVYRPTGDVAAQVLYFHGGGFVVGDLDTCDAHCRALAARVGAVVTSVDYSLAPEHPYPEPVDEGLQALRWVCSQGGRDGTSRSPIGIAGDSAGANLAASVLLQVRSDPAIAVKAQLLLYPMLDPSLSFPSVQENGEGYGLDRETLEWFWRMYLPPGAAERYAVGSPLTEPAAGMPASIVVTAGYDPLRDEGEAYAGRLLSAGVPTTTLRYDSLVHGFFGFGSHAPAAQSAISEICTVLRDTLLAGRVS